MSRVLTDDLDAYLFLEAVRWGGMPPPCPHCGVCERSYHLTPSDGRSRATRTGTRTVRRVWKCGSCRRQFSVLTGTILAGTRVSILTWVGVIAVLCGPDPVDAPDAIVDRFGVTRQTARHMIARVRAGIAALDVG